MDKKNVIKTLELARKGAKKRSFSQTFDLVVNLRDIDMKKQEQQIDFYAVLLHPTGKPAKICGLVGPELEADAKAVLDKTINQEEFTLYQKEPRRAKKLAREFSYFIGQANIMPKIAQAFGKALGTKGKMPNPKAGCIVPPKTNLQPLYEKLQKTVRLKTRNSPTLQISIGTESMKDEEIADNLMNIYDQIIHHLPNEKNNLRSVYLKLTMGTPVRVDDSGTGTVMAAPEVSAKKPVKAAEKKEETEQTA